MERVSGAWPSVEAVGNGIEIVLGEGAQVGALGQVLAQQAVGVLACAALPGTVGVAEVDHAGSGGEILVASQLFALIVGQAVTQWCGDRMSLAEKPASAEAAVASSMRASCKCRSSCTNVRVGSGTCLT